MDCDSCVAKTARSGSDMVIKMPTKKNAGKIIHSLLLLITVLPTYSPIGVIAVSAPSVNKPIPITVKNAPSKKDNILPFSTGINVEHNKITINAIGKTEEKASLILEFIAVLSTYKPFFFFI